MTRVWCGRADRGAYTDAFGRRGFVAVSGSDPIHLSPVTSHHMMAR